MSSNQIDRLRFAAKYPFSNNDSKYGPILKGGIFFLGSSLILPYFVLFGYMFEVIESVLLGDDEIPRFTNYGRYFKQGLIGFVALLPVFLIGFLSNTLINILRLQGVAQGSTVLIGVSLSFILSLAGSYITPALLIQFARKRSIVETYDLEQLSTLVFSKDYIIGSVFFYVLVSIAYIGFAFLSLLIIPLLLFPFIGAYLIFVSQAFFADIYAEVDSDEEEDETKPYG